MLDHGEGVPLAVGEFGGNEFCFSFKELCQLGSLLAGFDLGPDFEVH